MLSIMQLIKHKIRVLHHPQIPCKPFIREVNNEREAYLLIETLADQHLFLFHNKFIPDYANIVTLEMFEDGEWCSYYN